MLSWTVTIQILQEIILERAAIDFGKKNFAKVQIYVAKSISGIAKT